MDIYDVDIDGVHYRITGVMLDELKTSPNFIDVTKLGDKFPSFTKMKFEGVEIPRPPVPQATNILLMASEYISNRASERDAEAERSMLSTVNAFNAMFGTNITEVQGWQFMELLEMSRSRGGKFRLNDFVDGAAYAALAGEAAAKDDE
jgi:hypothetical protein